MEADAVVLLGAEDIDVPPSWFRPGTPVIRCGPTQVTGIVEIITLCERYDTLHGTLL